MAGLTPLCCPACGELMANDPPASLQLVYHLNARHKHLVQVKAATTYANPLVDSPALICVCCCGAHGSPDQMAEHLLDHDDLAHHFAMARLGGRGMPDTVLDDRHGRMVPIWFKDLGFGKSVAK